MTPAFARIILLVGLALITIANLPACAHADGDNCITICQTTPNGSLICRTTCS